MLSAPPDRARLCPSLSATRESVPRFSVAHPEIPAQALLYPQIGGYFLSQMEKVITEDHLPVTLVKNNYNVTQHLIRTTNFLATISTL